jgi:hypothetical protein
MEQSARIAKPIDEVAIPQCRQHYVFTLSSPSNRRGPPERLAEIGTVRSKTFDFDKLSPELTDTTQHRPTQG